VKSTMNDAATREAEERAEVWRQLSALAHQARHTPIPSAFNDVLRSAIEDDPEGPFAPAYLLWTGDALLQEARFQEAIEVYDGLVQRYPDRRLGPQPFARMALEQRAICHERLGEPEEATRALTSLLEASYEGISPSWLHYRIGQISENARADEVAIRSYRRAAESAAGPHSAGFETRELARRAADRLERPGDGTRPRPELVAEALARALERRDSDALSSLASPTHFTVGAVGSERSFVEPAGVLDRLRADLRKSKVQVDPARLSGCGGKLYLSTDGWAGDLLAGNVVFILTRARDRWEWSGIALTRLGRAWEDVVGPVELRENQPLSLSIKAPWPAGLSFRAGGLIGFAAPMLAFASLPFGWGLAAMLLASANRCGFGPGGLYYNQPTTHVGNEAFSIDFARFQPGVPLLPLADGTPVLAVADGLVTGVTSFAANGDPSTGNLVRIEHMTEAELFGIFIVRFFTGERRYMRYSSRVLHLAGPQLIPVSEGMHVKQGRRLGFIDDTGNSVASHLHFTVYDNTTIDPALAAQGYFGSSVRPTPMDGQSLLDADDGRCVSSTNVPLP